MQLKKKLKQLEKTEGLFGISTKNLIELTNFSSVQEPLLSSDITNLNI